MTKNGTALALAPARTNAEPSLEHKRAILEGDLAEYIKIRWNTEIRLKVLQRLEDRKFAVTKEDKKTFIDELARLQTTIELYEDMLAELLEGHGDGSDAG